MGDVTGRRLLHLQSHIGIDTLGLALAGAVNVMGVDFSPRAVAAAQSIARRLARLSWLWSLERGNVQFSRGARVRRVYYLNDAPSAGRGVGIQTEEVVEARLV
ncbi:MAG: hypothetical protein Q7V14_05325 [Coriobacteriia bacterium]|nr:hypothetical protein [Coriobacteriia bacterium]